VKEIKRLKDKSEKLSLAEGLKVGLNRSSEERDQVAAKSL